MKGVDSRHPANAILTLEDSIQIPAFQKGSQLVVQTL